MVDPGRYRVFGVEQFANCQVRDTRSVASYMLDRPVAPRVTALSEKGKMTYYGVCSGCHAYSTRLVGPPVNTIQAMYKNNAKGIMEFITKPVHKRDDYPEMPPQDYLSEETRLAVSEYMLTITK